MEAVEKASVAGLANKPEGKSAKLLTPTVLTFYITFILCNTCISHMPESKKSSCDDRHEQLLM
jgi:hypothetical protein